MGIDEITHLKIRTSQLAYWLVFGKKMGIENVMVHLVFINKNTLTENKINKYTLSFT